MQHREQLSNAWADFLSEFHWDWFCTHTFRGEPHPERAAKAYRYYIRQLSKGLYGQSAVRKGRVIRHCVALEHHKSGVIHFHALMGDDPSLNYSMSRIAASALWRELEGFAWIVPIDDQVKAVTGYVSKYVAKGGQIDLSPDLIRTRSRKVG